MLFSYVVPGTISILRDDFLKAIICLLSFLLKRIFNDRFKVQRELKQRRFLATYVNRKWFYILVSRFAQVF